MTFDENKNTWLFPKKGNDARVTNYNHGQKQLAGTFAISHSYLFLVFLICAIAASAYTSATPRLLCNVVC